MVLLDLARQVRLVEDTHDAIALFPGRDRVADSCDLAAHVGAYNQGLVGAAFHGLVVVVKAHGHCFGCH